MQKIKRTNIAKGVFYIEIPEAELRILCGCPADSIKHLYYLGIIQFRKESDVVYETGPNAILVSDQLDQYGEISNLCEFPVLHMFYKQGVIIPGHPNNNGEKPLLVGKKEQVDAQMEYVSRGNYGLRTADELEKAGISGSLQDDHIKMKFCFNYGDIPEMEELITPVYLGKETAEIKNSVFIKRLEKNKFLLSYKGESEEIDLNLSRGECYSPPFKLPENNITKGYFSVIHTGQGDGWDCKRPCFGSILHYDGKIYLIDAGPNILYILKSLGLNIDDITGIFLTHIHDDHFAGLPKFIDRKKKICIYSSKMVRHSAMKKLAALYSKEDSYFTDCFDFYDLEIDLWNDIEGLGVRPVYSAHPVETTAYIFKVSGKDKDYTFAHYADIITLSLLEKMIAKEGKTGVSQEFFNKIKKDYLTPADLKKVDVGGGSIHGSHYDFINDKSQRLILGHTSEPLNEEQKRVGNDVQFGECDILIKDKP